MKRMPPSLLPLPPPDLQLAFCIWSRSLSHSPLLLFPPPYLTLGPPALSFPVFPQRPAEPVGKVWDGEEEQ